MCTCYFQKYPDALAPRLEDLGVNLGGLAPRHPDTFENSKYSLITTGVRPTAERSVRAKEVHVKARIIFTRCKVRPSSLMSAATAVL